MELNKLVETAVQKGLEEAITKKYELLKVKLLEDLEREKLAVISGIAVDVMRQVSIASIGEEVVIKLKPAN